MFIELFGTGGQKWKKIADITGKSPKAVKTMMSDKRPLPKTYLLVMYVFDKMEKENRELKEEVRRLKK